MRYAREHNETTRERILDAASRLFREHGIAGVGLATIMGEVGLTVGTFYTHFESKEALLKEVLVRTLQARHSEFEKALQGEAFEFAVRAYLSPEHRDSVGSGCPVAALAAEVARHPRATRATFATHNAPSLDVIAAGLSLRRGVAVSRAEAAAFLGLLVGTLQLARAAADRAESTRHCGGWRRAARSASLSSGPSKTTDDSRGMCTPNVIPNVPLGASGGPVLRSQRVAKGSAKTPWRRSRAPAGLPKLGVAGSNPVRRSRFLLWESFPART